MTSTPPRLRDLQEASRVSRRSRGKFLLIAAVSLVSIVVLILAYGLLRQTVFRPAVESTIDESDVVVRAGEQIQVEVINACGVDGVARRVTEFLRARRFDVAETNTSKIREAHSRVLDRVGDLASARKVAYAIGIPEGHVETQIDSSLFLRATVIIGNDYQNLRPMR